MSLHIVCPHCHATNRVPADRLGASPKCGACHQTLFAGQPVELTEAHFNRHITNNDIPVLVDFWAPWCGPCRQIAPTIDQIAVEFAGKLKVMKMNVDENLDVPARYGVQGIPTLLLFKGGDVVEKLVGAYPKPALVSRINQHL